MRRRKRRRSGKGEAKSESVTHRPTFNPSTPPPPSRHELKFTDWQRWQSWQSLNQTLTKFPTGGCVSENQETLLKREGKGVKKFETNERGKHTHTVWWQKAKSCWKKMLNKYSTWFKKRKNLLFHTSYLHVWSYFKFIHMTDVDKFKFYPHVE